MGATSHTSPRLPRLLLMGGAVTLFAVWSSVLLSLPPPQTPDLVEAAVHPYRWEHDAMLQQMRVDVTPAMVALMNDDPVWRLMRDPNHIRLAEQEQADIDRMLARRPYGAGR